MLERKLNPRFELPLVESLSHIPVAILDLISEYALPTFDWDYNRGGKLEVIEYGIAGCSKTMKETSKLQSYRFIKASKQMSSVFSCGKIVMFGRTGKDLHSYLPGSTRHDMMVTKDRPFLRFRIVSTRTLVGLTFIKKKDQAIEGYGYNDKSTIVFKPTGSPYKGSLPLLEWNTQAFPADFMTLKFFDFSIDYDNYTVRYENVETGKYKIYRLSHNFGFAKRFGTHPECIGGLEEKEDSFGKYKRMKENLLLGISPLIYTWNAAAVYIPESNQVTKAERKFFTTLRRETDIFKRRGKKLADVSIEDFKAAEDAVSSPQQLSE